MFSGSASLGFIVKFGFEDDSNQDYVMKSAGRPVLACSQLPKHPIAQNNELYVCLFVAEHQGCQVCKLTVAQHLRYA